jgi:tRNA threonylcarbamoyladenosine biosynthesis protein TsaE
MKNFLISKKFIFDQIQIKKFGTSLASFLSKGDLVFLIGDLGSGKTFFVKNLCEFFQKNEAQAKQISSPTFLFYHQYKFEKINIWHYDLYRFENQISENDLMDIDFFEAIEDGCVFVEWADKLKNFDNSQQNSIEIYINFLENSELREYEIRFHPNHSKWNKFFSKL